MKVLGIDPGSNFLGIGCVEARGTSMIWVGHTVVRLASSKEDFALNLKIKGIFESIHEAIALWKPNVVAIEEVFFAKNPQSALKLGQARGAALAPCALAGLPIHEYSASIVKQTVTGSGRAEKGQVQRMVQTVLHTKGMPRLEFEREDASDALAIAICHLQNRHKQDLLRASSSAASRLLLKPRAMF